MNGLCHDVGTVLRQALAKPLLSAPIVVVLARVATMESQRQWRP